MSNKIAVFMIGMTGLLILFYIGGLLPADAISTSVLNVLMNIRNLGETEFLDRAVSVMLGAGLIAGVAVGYFTKNFELAAIAPFAVYTLYLMIDFSMIFIKFSSLNTPLATLLFAPIMFYWIYLIVDWWRGRA